MFGKPREPLPKTEELVKEDLVFRLLFALYEKMKGRRDPHFRERDIHKAWPFVLMALRLKGVKGLMFFTHHIRDEYEDVASAISEARLWGFLYQRSPSRSDDDTNFFNEPIERSLHVYREARRDWYTEEEERELAFAISFGVEAFFSRATFRDCVAETYQFDSVRPTAATL